MSAFAVLIWVGSVYLNWHYAIDGVVGAAGAILIWFASGWIVDRLLAAVAKEPGAVPAIATAAA
jgi:membrane-associated phospholipid phosphatase